MFLSLSACQPNSVVTSSFVASSDQLLDISANLTLSVNDEVTTLRPVTVFTGDTVSVSVVTPENFLDYEIYDYTIDSTKNYFAVVNKNNYTPVVKPSDAGKRWFNYAPEEFRVSFYDNADDFLRPLGTSRRLIDIANTHIALDHINNAVCFYSTGQELISRVNLPSGPVEYKKISYYDNNLETTATEALILCADKRLYRIRFDNRYTDSNEYSPTVIPVEIADNLWFDQDLPTGESFIESRRNAFLAKTKPPTTALDITSNNIWIAGYDAVYLLNRNFQQVAKIDLPDEKIINIAALNNDAIAVSRDGKIFYISSQGTYTQLLQTAALGAPCSINSGTAVAVPDLNNQRLMIFTDGTGSYTTWDTPDFAPAYARLFDDILWVTGHDNNKVMKFNSSTSYEFYDFGDKVALVSVVGNSILAMHYLQNFVTLDLTGIQKIIPVEFLGKTGPLGHIGSDPVRVKMLGEENIPMATSPGLVAWTNGIHNEPVKTGDYIGVSFKAEYNGVFNSVLIIGDTAYDYKVIAESTTKPGDYFEPTTVARNRLTAPATAYIPPDSGDVDTGVTGPIELGFDWNMWGQLHNQIYVTTDGLVVFANNNSITTNRLHVEPRNLYQGGAINNVDPNNIYEKLSSVDVPGLYIKNGVIDEFNYLRLRWVGTEAQANLTGYTTTVTSNTTSTVYIPVDNASSIEVGNYVSGNGIVSSTQVIDTAIYNRTVEKIKQVNNFLVINNIVDFEYLPYSTVTGTTTGNIDLVSAILNVSSTNKILLSNTTVIKTSQISSFPTPELFSARIALTTGLSTVNSNITDMTASNNTVTCLSVIDTVKFTVSEADYETLYVNQLLVNDQTNLLLRITSKSFSETLGFIITTGNNHNLAVSDTLTARSLDISFNGTLPSNILTGGNLTLFSYSLAVDSAAQFQQDTYLNIKANIAVVDQPLSLTEGSELLFANDYAAPAYTYEVGLYQGKNYQYIEYFYDSPNHNPEDTVGINLGQSTELTATSPAARSIVFSGNLSSGDFTNFNGLGTFNEISDNFIPRNITYVKSITDNDQQDRIEIFIDRQITADDQVRIASSYGYLQVNSVLYYGDSFITENSVISLKTPVNDSFRPIAPILGIGDLQVSIPMISRQVTSPPQQIIEIYDNQTTNSIVTANVTIPVAGSYFIPDYFRYPEILANLDISFQRVRNGTITNLDWGDYEFLAGDVVVINRQLTPKGLYDYIDVDIVGPVALRVRWRTSKGQIFNQLNFGTLEEPYTRNDREYIENIIDGIVTYEEDSDYYVTGNITLTANSITSGKLYVDTPEAEFLVNGQVIGNTLTNVNTGANIALQRKVLNYFQNNVDIYQIKYDSITSTNVFIPIGTWDINNKIVFDAVTEKVTQHANVSPIIPEYTTSTVLNKALELPEQYGINAISTVVFDSQLITGQYIETGRLTSNILDYTQLNIDPEIEYESFNQNNLTVTPQESLLENANNEFTAGLATELLKGSSMLSAANLFELATSKNYFSEKLNEFLISNNTVFDFSLDKRKDLISSILISSLVLSAAANSTVMNSNNQANEEINKNILIDTLQTVEENSSNYNLNRLTNEFETKIAYNINRLQLDLTSTTNFFKILATYEIDSVKAVLHSSLTRAFDRVTSNITDKLDLALENIKSKLFDQLTRELENTKQIITENLDSSFETKKTISSDSLTLSNETNKTINTDSLSLDLTNFKTILTSSIVQDLENTKNTFNNRIVQDLEQSTTSISDQIINDLTNIKTILSYVLTLDSDMEKTILNDKLTVVFDSAITNLTDKVVQDIEKIKTLVSSINSAEYDLNQQLLNNTTNKEIDLSPTTITKIIDPIAEKSKQLIEQNVQVVSEQLKTIVERLVERSFEVNNTEITKLLEKEKDNVGNLLTLLLTTDKEEKSYIEQKFEYIKDQIQHITKQIEFIKQGQGTYLNIIPNLVYDVKHLISYDQLETIIDAKREWVTDELNTTGATNSVINIFANNGRGGDKITNMGTPPDIGPMIQYTKEYNYGLGSFEQGIDASNIAVKYVNASAFQIVGTDFWNYRIYFDKKVYCVPKKGRVFPLSWFIRGG